MLDLDIDQQFAIHATAIAIKEFDREELEEAFVEMLYNKAVERQTFINIMKEHGIDAEITLTFLNANQVPE
tara:strand:+ start:1302 stop:1514 length:213 start_codon:yes stop_codon:yes gene_type:complete